MRQAGRRRTLGNEPVVTGADVGDDGGKRREQRRAVRFAVKPCHAIERRPLGGQAVRLLVLDHLQPVLDPPQRRIMARQTAGDLGFNSFRCRQRRERIDRRRDTQRRIAPP